MEQVTTIGLDIAKSVFQVHGIAADGTVVFRRQLRRAQVLPFFEKREAGALPCGDRGLCHVAPLGARDHGAGS
jgi:transposase